LLKEKTKKASRKNKKAEPGQGMTFGGNGARLAQGLGKNPTFRCCPLEVFIAYISVLASFKLQPIEA
jgi:hypothetical protein